MYLLYKSDFQSSFLTVTLSTTQFSFSETVTQVYGLSLDQSKVTSRNKKIFGSIRSSFAVGLPYLPE